MLFKDHGQLVVGQQSQHVYSSGQSWKVKRRKPAIFFFIALTVAQDKIAQIVSSHHICSGEKTLVGEMPE